MKLNPKQLAASAALLGVLACAAALPASAAGPVTTPLALTLPKVSFPWDKVTAESIETGSYDAAPLAGREYFDCMVTKKEKKPYVLLYSLNGYEETEKLAEDVAEFKGLKLIELSGRRKPEHLSH